MAATRIDGMKTVRRLYVYIVAGVSITALAIGGAQLLDILFAEIANLWTDSAAVERDSQQFRQDLALFGSIVIVALPIWGVHWWLAERAIRGDDGTIERQSTVRAVYLALALILPIFYGFPWAINLMTRLLGDLFNASGYGRSLATALAVLITTGTIWGFHAWTRLRDERAGPLKQPANWPIRLYVYAATFIGGVIALVGLIQLAQLPGEIINPDDFAPDDSWQTLLIDGVAGFAVGGLIWSAHWVYTMWLIHRDSWQAIPERRSVLRRGYLYLVVLIGTIGALAGVVVTLQQPLELLFGLLEDHGTRETIQHMIDPLLIACLFGLVWVFHRRQIIVESTAYAEAAMQISIRRLYVYMMVAVGLAIGAASLAWLLGIGLDLLVGGERTVGFADDWWREQVSFFLPAVLIGVALWFNEWRRVLGWVRSNPEAERIALSRRIYLYTVLAVAVIATLIALSVLIYRLMAMLLGVGSISESGSEFSTVSGILVVALAVAGYHAWLVWQDVQIAGERAGETLTANLILTGPAGVDLEPLLREMQTHLPDGYRLERR